MDEPVQKPKSLIAETQPDLLAIFDRARAGEFRCIALRYGRKPGEPFAVVGVLWPRINQTELI